MRRTLNLIDFPFSCPFQIKVDNENWLGADKTGGLEILAQKGKIKVHMYMTVINETTY